MSNAPTQASPTFDLTMVREKDVTKQLKGGQANVKLVAKTTDLQALEFIGRGCVDHFLQEQKAAYCQVWATERDFNARDRQHIGELNCWAYFIGVPLVGGEPTVQQNSQDMYELMKCPGALYR